MAANLYANSNESKHSYHSEPNQTTTIQSTVEKTLTTVTQTGFDSFIETELNRHRNRITCSYFPFLIYSNSILHHQHSLMHS